eukprot:c74_g1_i2.p2 GENE.c74_g1_i2~~c74_g1_i2.p2  ORF type:complete len:151 (+),score=23.11 c74_g1_i2:42-494(+)
MALRGFTAGVTSLAAFGLFCYFHFALQASEDLGQSQGSANLSRALTVGCLLVLAGSTVYDLKSDDRLGRRRVKFVFAGLLASVLGDVAFYLNTRIYQLIGILAFVVGQSLYVFALNSTLDIRPHFALAMPFFAFAGIAFLMMFRHIKAGA